MIHFPFLRGALGALSLLYFLSAGLWGQPLTPIVFEAESGDLGAEMEVVTLGSPAVTFVRVTTDVINGSFPGSAARVARYEVTFPAAGVYELYMRVYVEAGGFNDDSLFYSRGIGTTGNPTDPEQWVIVNQLASASGYMEPNAVVLSEGEAGQQVWKWVKLTGFDFAAASAVFEVPTGQLGQSFWIGGREDGLRIDKIAFAREGVYLTVRNLDEGTAGSLTPPDAPVIREGPPIATNKPKFFGSIHSPSQIANFANYFNQVTPENAGKWRDVEATRDQMNWAPLDQAYALAKDNGFSFRFHVLVWGSQQPAWIESLSPAEQREEIEEWFRLVAQRYPGIDYLEVVNEPLHQPPSGAGTGNYLEALGGSGETGWDWIITAFEMAREIFPPNVKLMINDYSITNSNETTTRYLQIIELLQARNLIDAIGDQAHAFSTRGNMATITHNLNRLAATGLPIIATEFDLDGQNGDAAQLADYQRVFPTFWEHPGVIGVTLWGYRPGLWRNEQQAWLANADNSERPALVWLQAYIEGLDPFTFERYLERQGADTETHTFEADIDGDGLTTGWEYLFGTSPFVANAGREGVWADPLTGEGGLTLGIQGGLNEGYLVVERSGDLIAWFEDGTYDFATKTATGNTRQRAQGTEVWIENLAPLGTEAIHYRATFFRSSEE